MPRIRILLVCLVAAIAGPNQAAELPDEHAYQKTLRDYLATLTAEDFQLDVQPIEAPKGELADWKKYRAIISLQEYGQPALQGVTGAAGSFTLAQIESGDQVQMPAGGATSRLAWLIDWRWDGNPYFHSRPAKLRAFVMLAVDLIMHDHLHEHGDGSANRSDFLGGTIEYARIFKIDNQAGRVETTVTGDGTDAIAELYEIVPIFLREARYQRDVEPTRIEFQIAGKWNSATTQLQKNVLAVRAHRFDGVVRITFDQPQQVKLSAEDWTDGYQSHATCRNVLIDLQPPARGESWQRTVAWTISP